METASGIQESPNRRVESQVTTPISNVDIKVTEKDTDGKDAEVIKTIHQGSIVEYPSTHRLKIETGADGKPHKAAVRESGMVEKIYLEKEASGQMAIKVSIRTPEEVIDVVNAGDIYNSREAAAVVMVEGATPISLVTDIVEDAIKHVSKKLQKELKI